MNLLEYFLLMLKSSLLSTGGFGPLPILHEDFIARGWATEQSFTEALAVGQTSPGPNGLWVVSFGYLTAGLPGALLATLGLLLPPFLVLFVQRLYQRIGGHLLTRGFLDGMALAIGGAGIVVFGRLLLANGLQAASDWRSLVILAGGLLLAQFNKLPVVALIALGALAGIVLYS